MLGCADEPLPAVPAQEAALLSHCAHARYVWNLAVEQRSWWQPGRPAPRFATQCRQLSEARAAFPWLAAGSVIIQQQALRDFHAAWASYFAALREWRRRYARTAPDERPDPPGQPSWRKRGLDEGFRVVATGPQDVQRLNRRWAQLLVPKLGWVRFRWSRPVPEARSYRVTRDRAGRWHVAFCAVPPPIPGPGTGEVVGIDRGVTVTLMLSDGRRYQAPADRGVERLQGRLDRARRGSIRRAKLKGRLAWAHARNADARRDWVEQRSTQIARGYDLIRVEDLDVRNMTRSGKGTVERPGRNVRQKAGLNRAILASGWGMFAARLEHKAAGRLEKVDPAFTSWRCSECGTVDRKARESQAVFRCRSCGYSANADLNAARNIAAGHAARGGRGLPGRRTANLNCRPSMSRSWNPRPSGRGGCQEVDVVVVVPVAGGGAEAGDQVEHLLEPGDDRVPAGPGGDVVALGPVGSLRPPPERLQGGVPDRVRGMVDVQDPGMPPARGGALQVGGPVGELRPGAGVVDRAPDGEPGSRPSVSWSQMWLEAVGR